MTTEAPPIPQDRLDKESSALISYPPIEMFEYLLNEFLDVYYVQKHPEINPPENPQASDVAQFAHADWKEILNQGNEDIILELHKLGNTMFNESVYRNEFNENKTIVIDNNWQVVNGQKPALALRILGKDFVEKSGINKWVKVEKEV
jgi:hypothetical protein